MDLNLSISLLERDKVLPYLAIPVIGISLMRLMVYLAVGDAYMASLSGIAVLAFSIPLVLHILKETKLAQVLFFTFSVLVLTAYAILLGPASGLNKFILVLIFIPLLFAADNKSAGIAVGICLFAFMLTELSHLMGWPTPVNTLSQQETLTSLTQLFAVLTFFGIIFAYRQREFAHFQQVDEQTHLLKEENRFLQHIGYHMTHDFGQSMRIITQRCQLLSEKYQHNNPYFTSLETEISEIEANSRRAHDLITEMSMYLAVQKGHRPFIYTDLNQVMEEVRDAMLPQIEAAAARVSIVGPMPVVKAVHFEWTFLFQNLLENALKYGDKEQPSVIVTSIPSSVEHVIIFQDNGVGIPASHRERIFEPFARALNPNGTPGTGLGLFICKEIISRMKGKIRVESTPGVGTSFFITIPKSPVPNPLA